MPFINTSIPQYISLVSFGILLYSILRDFVVTSRTLISISFLNFFFAETQTSYVYSSNSAATKHSSAHLSFPDRVIKPGSVVQEKKNSKEWFSFEKKSHCEHWMCVCVCGTHILSQFLFPSLSLFFSLSLLSCASFLSVSAHLLFN